LIDNDSLYVYDGRDSLFTNWFRLDSDTLVIKISSIDTAANFYIQYDDNYLMPLPFPRSMLSNIAYKMRYAFYNGNGSYYRLVIIKQDTLATYQEQTIIDTIPILIDVLETINLSRPIVYDVPNSSEQSYHIQLEVTPIPAKNIVYVTVRLPEQLPLSTSMDISLKLLSLEGNELLGFIVQPNHTNEISLEKYSQGVYFLKAEIVDSKHKVAISPATKQFIIER